MFESCPLTTRPSADVEGGGGGAARVNDDPEIMAIAMKIVHHIFVSTAHMPKLAKLAKGNSSANAMKICDLYSAVIKV